MVTGKRKKTLSYGWSYLQNDDKWWKAWAVFWVWGYVQERMLTSQLPWCGMLCKGCANWQGRSPAWSTIRITKCNGSQNIRSVLLVPFSIKFSLIKIEEQSASDFLEGWIVFPNLAAATAVMFTLSWWNASNRQNIESYGTRNLWKFHLFCFFLFCLFAA